MIVKQAEKGKPPMKVQILVKDVDTGVVYIDTVSDIAIVGCVNSIREKSDAEKPVPHQIITIGKAKEKLQMLFVLAQEVGKEAEIQGMAPGINYDKPAAGKAVN